MMPPTSARRTTDTLSRSSRPDEQRGKSDPATRPSVSQRTLAREAEASRIAYTQSLARAVNFLADLGMHPENAPAHVEKYDPDLPHAKAYRMPVTPERMRQAATYLRDLATAWEAR